MIFNKENVKKLNEQRDALGRIPNKLKNDEKYMEERERLVELSNFASKLDHEEQHAVAMGLNPFIMIDAVRELMYEQNEYIRKIDSKILSDNTGELI